MTGYHAGAIEIESQDACRWFGPPRVVPAEVNHSQIEPEAPTNRVRPLCHCLRVMEADVRETIIACELSTVREVTRACGAGGGCMACHRHIKRLLAEHGSTPAPVTVPALIPGFA